jgi:hypothetical protein
MPMLPSKWLRQESQRMHLQILCLTYLTGKVLCLGVCTPP